MENLFLAVLNMSIAASWLILAVLLLRLPMKKAPRWAVCLLWAVVGLRLVCPFQPESVLSLIPSAETVSADIVYAEVPEIHSGVPFLNQAVNPVLEASLSPEPGESANPMQIVVAAASAVWLAGLASLLVYALVSWLRLRRRVRAAVPAGDGLWVCDDVPSPFILGLFRPCIYLPSGMNERQAALAAAHERAHLARHDQLWKPLGFLLLAVYWFNPLCWAAYILLCRDIESACDERVIRPMPLSERKAYSEALLACSLPRRAVAACPLAFGETGVKTRIRNVLHYRRPAFWVILAAVVLCLAVSVCFLTNPVYPAQLRVGGALYTQSGAAEALPADAVQVGRLLSIRSSTRERPDGSMTGTNLAEKYAGCAIYEREAGPQTVYLEDPDGGWLPFEQAGAAVYRPVRCAFAFDSEGIASGVGRTLAFTLPEYPDVEFRCGTGGVEAVTSGGTAELFHGMPLLDVYFADLNGDGLREICGTAYYGSGVIDARVYAYEWSEGKLYELSDRSVYDFRLTMQDGRLLTVKTPYGGYSPVEAGWLALRDGALTMENTSALAGTAYVTDRLLYVNPLSSTLPTDDSGRTYYVDLGWNAMTVVDRATGEVIAAVRDAPAQWERLSPETLDELFLFVPDEIAALENAEVLRLPDGYCLFRADGALWVGEGLREKTGVWYVYSLRPADAQETVDAPAASE